LLFNNGLHWEHHAHPERSWHELTPDDESPRISMPHLVFALVRAPLKELTDVG